MESKVSYNGPVDVILLKEVFDKNPFITVDLETENKQWSAVAESVASKAVSGKIWKKHLKLMVRSVCDRTLLLLHHYKKENWANIRK